ncbi:LamG-like jellyroll fold domain-containing protein [Amycolatopsis sp. cmx-11-12]|uniref:LamG-like jellyroll fold domain-containing protein n=1 Tax=Amycolatopsis sp. cmx-11-12 TaxID=2785795 RepID=UPI003917FD6E
MSRWISVLLVLVVVLPLAGSAVEQLAPAGPLPAGASGSAPGQRSGTAGDVRAGGAAQGLEVAARNTERPPGAVPDQAHLPEIRGYEHSPQTVTPAVAPQPRTGGGFDANTSVEQVPERTERTQTFHNADGTRTLRVHTDDKQVRQPDGSLRPVDLGLAPDERGVLTPKTGRADVRFAGRMSAENTANLSFDDRHGLGYRPNSVADAPAEVDGSKVSYRGVLPGVDLRFAATNTGFTEDLVLAGPQTATSFSSLLRPRGLEPRLDPASGAVNLVDDEGKVHALLPTGYLVDSAGRPARSEGVRYTLDKLDAATWRLRTDVDSAWLHDPARVFPVVVTSSAGRFDADADDTFVRTGSTADHSREPGLEVGSSNGGKDISRSYLRFSDAMTRLRNQYVVGASLVVDNIESQTCEPRPVTVFEVSEPWSGAAMRWPGAAVGEALSTREFAHAGKTGSCVNPAWEAFPLEPRRVSEWTHGAPFHGLSLRATNEGDSHGWKRFAAVDSANKPYLDVTYSSEGAAYEVTGVTLPTANRHGEIRAVVTNQGSSLWPAGGGFRLGYVVKQDGNVVATSQGTGPAVDIGPGGKGNFIVPLQNLVPAVYDVEITMFDPQGRAFNQEYGVPYGTFRLKVENVPPTSNRQQPGSGATVESLTPTLYAEGIDPDNWPASGLKYRFVICANQELTEGCQESGWTGQSWAPPRNTLKWSSTYYWAVRVHDNVAETPNWVGPLVLTTRVPQPQITAHLAGSPGSTEGPGLDPQIGNYSTATTDVSVPTVGPDLTITRTYNSLDPRRDTAFGVGWASRLDMRLAEDGDSSGNVVVTFPSGRQVRLGRNPDGPGEQRNYAPPAGQNITLVYNQRDAVYTLRDASGSRWQFDALGRLATIIDPAGLTERLEYNISDQVVAITNDVSKRSLSLIWRGKHVEKVQTEAPEPGAQPLVWAYAHEGDRLTKACAPGGAPNCTTYGYQVGSHYRSSVIDDNPKAYWRLAETTGDTAANAVARADGANAGKYHNVVLGADGAVGGTVDKAATFDGNGSFVTLPEKLTTGSMSLAVELWFKTTRNGVLIAHADRAFSDHAGQSTPVLYVGTDGLLYGGFSMREVSGPRQVASKRPVNDGNWHHAVVSAAIDHQKMYLDGVEQGQANGYVDHGNRGHLVLGAGSGKDWPATNGADFYFGGSIDEVAFYQHPLGALAAKQHHAVGQPIDQLASITLPQDNRLFAKLTYNDVQDRVAILTDHDGREWRLDTPKVTETTVGDKTTARRNVVLRGPYPDWTYIFDPDNGGRLVERAHSGHSRRYEYNTKDFSSVVIDENGHRTEQTTDDRGNVLSEKSCRTKDSCNTSYSTYLKPSSDRLDPRTDKLESTSDARSSGADDTRFRTTYTYDALGRLQQTTLPMPQGASGQPIETRSYTKGTEAAVDGGTVPAGLLLKDMGRRGQVTSYFYRRNGDLAEVSSPTGLRTKYGYDQLGRQKKVSVTNGADAPFGTTEYTYTARSQVESVTEPAVLNPITGVSHAKVTRYRYDGNGNTVETTVGDTTAVDKGGDATRSTTFSYDAHDRLASTTFSDGGRETKSYRNNNLEQTITDVRGFSWTSQFDDRGRLRARNVSGKDVDPDNPAATVLTLELREYDPVGRLSSVSDAMGRRTAYSYYDDDLLAATTRNGYVGPDQQTRDVVLERRGYDSAGNVTELITAGDRKTTTEYDAAGYESRSTVDPAGLKRTTAYFRDRDGNAERIERSGAVAPGRVEVTRYTYDPANQIAREDAELGSGVALSTVYDRDERGLLKQMTDRRLHSTRYAYDPAGQLVSTTNPPVDAWVNGVKRAGFVGAEVLGRNAFGEITQARDSSGGVTRTEHDAMGRPTGGVLPDYTPPGGQTIRDARTTTEYDRAGNPTKTTDSLGRVTEQSYDPYGRIRSITLPKVGAAPNVGISRYDRNGELVSKTSPSGAESRFTYDELGRQITATEVDRFPGPTAYYTTELGYDDAGNVTSTRTPQGFVSSATYNAADEMAKQTDATGRVTTTAYDDLGRPTTVTDAAGLISTTTYDLRGRPTRTAHVIGGQEKRATTSEYDENSNLVARTTPEGRRTTHGYDALNRPVAQTERIDANKSIETSLGYDLLGNRSRFVDGEQRATNYTYNSWGLTETTVDPETANGKELSARTWTTAYNAGGEAVRHTAPGGVTRVREYDAQGRLSVEKGMGAEVATTERTFGYDADGRTTKVSGVAGESTYGYDDRGNLIGSAGAAGNGRYSYNGDGTLAARTDASGTASFSYDSAGRLTSTADSLTGRTVDQGYDQAGRLSTVTDRAVASRISRKLDYDEFGRLSSDKVVQTYDGGVPPRTPLGVEYGYDLDDKLKTKTSVSSAGAAANRYDYDGAGRLTSWTDPAGKATGYGWDKASNRISAGDTTFTYDERNRLRSGGGATYDYTARGTLSSVTENGQTRKLSFDAFDRLASDGGTNYRYDSLDRVTDRNGTAFQYAGTSNETVSDGKRLVSRLPDGTALSDKAVGATGPGKMLFADQHGDVVGRYLGAGVDGQRTFDPFGKVTASSVETSNIGYQGDWTDGDTGAVNMTARWYSPGTGTFASRDDWNNAPQPSSAANRYAYGNSDPIAHADPTGHNPVIAFLIALIIREIGRRIIVWIAKKLTLQAIRIKIARMFKAELKELEESLKNIPGSSTTNIAPGADWLGENGIPRFRVVNPPNKTGKPSSGSGKSGGSKSRSDSRKGKKSKKPSVTGQGVKSVPKPPPPPQWLVNAMTPLERPEAGSTVTLFRDPIVFLQPTEIIDRSLHYVDEVTRITMDDTDQEIQQAGEIGRRAGPDRASLLAEVTEDEDE